MHTLALVVLGEDEYVETLRRQGITRIGSIEDSIIENLVGYSNGNVDYGEVLEHNTFYKLSLNDRKKLITKAYAIFVHKLSKDGLNLFYEDYHNFKLPEKVYMEREDIVAAVEEIQSKEMDELFTTYILNADDTDHLFLVDIHV